MNAFFYNAKSRAGKLIVPLEPHRNLALTSGRAYHPRDFCIPAAARCPRTGIRVASRCTRCFYDNGLDVLALGDFVLEKPRT